MVFAIPRSRLLVPHLPPVLVNRRKVKRRTRLARRGALLLVAGALLSWLLIPLAFPLPEDLREPLAESPRVLDRDGQVLADFPRTDLFRHTTVPLGEIPPALLDATLVAEDKRFYQHDGMDPLATARAARDAWRHGRFVSGASTITQQLVKISSPPGPRTLRTKLREMLTARHLEFRWSKDEILAAYLNRIDYGNHSQGCREAAHHYFGKPLADLSLAESALLAGLPQSPSLHNPRLRPSSALDRRDWILDRLASERGYDPQQIAAAKAEPLHLVTPSHPTEIPHLLSELRRSPDPDGAIHTTIEAGLQAEVNDIVREELRALSHANARHAAVVVLDNRSGEVLTLVGSGDFHDPQGGQINGALVPRSAGSTLKPFTYLLAFERRGLSPGSIVADIPTPYRTEEGLDLPRNFDRRHYGPVSIRHALANSLNVSAMRTLNEVGGPAPLHGLLRKLGLTTLADSPDLYGLGLTVGNAEVRLLELTNAYATLARLGIPRPVTILRDRHRPRELAPLFGAEAAYQVIDILADNSARSAAFGPRSPLRLPFRTAVKTGTSSDFRDNWCIGFTNEVTVGVWVGNFDNTPMRGVSGVAGAGPIFHRTMMAVHRERPARWMEQPAGLVRVPIDSRTGHRFLVPPPPGRPFVTTDLYPAQRLPRPVQNSDYDARGRAALDESYREWFLSEDNNRRDDFVLTTLPPADLSPKIISPLPTATYLLDPELPTGGRVLKLLSNLPTGARWSSPTLRITGDIAHLEPGRHEITLTDPRSGLHATQEIEVESL